MINDEFSPLITDYWSHIKKDIMFKNYLKTAFRNLGKNKLYSGINIIGLTAGLAACLLIGVFISHELSYDKFNKNADRIVRVTMEYKNAETINTTATTGTKVGPQFKRTFPAVEEYSRAFLSQGIVRYGEKVFDEQRILFADDPFFKIFQLDGLFLFGNFNNMTGIGRQERGKVLDEQVVLLVGLGGEFL